MGKTKELFEQRGLLNIVFKDSVTGENGIMDSGGNQVVGEIKNKGSASLAVSSFFFRELQSNGIPTHFLGKNNGSMIALKANPFPLEFICRLYACGSFLKRYGGLVKEMEQLPYLVEISIKDDKRKDPFISEDTILALGLMSRKELSRAKYLTLEATEIVEKVLKEKKIKLIDIKLEFGKVDGDLILIDEVSGDTMRVERNGTFLNQMELYKALVGKE